MSDDSNLRMESVTKALQQIGVLMNADKSKVKGGGTLTCPQCYGHLRWGFARVLRGRGPGRRGTRTAQTFAFACDTPGCIRGNGH